MPLLSRRPETAHLKTQPADAESSPPRVIDLRLVPVALWAWGITATVQLTPVHLIWLIPVLGVISGCWLALRGEYAYALVGAAVSLCVWMMVGQPLTDAAEHPFTHHYGKAIRVEATAAGFPVPSGDRLRVPVTVQGAALADDPHLIPVPAGPVTLRGGAQLASLTPGETLQFTATLRPPREHMSLGELTLPGDEQITTVAPASWHYRFVAELRAQTRQRTSAVIPATLAGLLTGMAYGDVTAISDADAQAYRTAGLTHLTAVSGSNIALMVGAAGLLFSFVGVGPRLRIAVCTGVLAGYVFLVGAEPSVTRAAVMGVVGLCAALVGRRHQAAAALSLAVIGICLFSSAWALHYGFVLSVAATAGLIIGVPYVQRPLLAVCPRRVAEAVSVAVVAQLVTMPIIALMTGSIQTYSVIANLLVVPVVAPVTLLGVVALLGGGGVPWLTELCALLAWPLVWWVQQVALHADALPQAQWQLPQGLVGVAAAAMLSVIGWLLLTRLRTGLLLAGVVSLVLGVSGYAPLWVWQLQSRHQLVACGDDNGGVAWRAPGAASTPGACGAPADAVIVSGSALAAAYGVGDVGDETATIWAVTSSTGTDLAANEDRWCSTPRATARRRDGSAIMLIAPGLPHIYAVSDRGVSVRPQPWFQRRDCSGAGN